MSRKWGDEALDFDEVAKYFSMPVAEAAHILGVSASALKGICRENGLHRWPHRKFLGGKTVEEIKSEALQAKQLAAQQQMYAPQATFMPQTAAQTIMQSTQHRTNLRISTTATYRTKMPMPSFLDDFKHGFPLKGLETASDRWWGKSIDDNKEPSPDSDSVKDATQLVNARKRKAESCAESLSSPVVRGYDGTKIQGEQLSVLKFVFGNEMPKSWAYALG